MTKIFMVVIDDGAPAHYNLRQLIKLLSTLQMNAKMQVRRLM